MNTTTVEYNGAHVLGLCEQLLSELDPKQVDAAEFLGRQYDLGLAWVHFPEGNGGLGASPKLQRVIDETLGRAGAPMLAATNPIGYGMSAPTIVTHGCEERSSATCVLSSRARRSGVSSSA